MINDMLNCNQSVCRLSPKSNFDSVSVCALPLTLVLS